MKAKQIFTVAALALAASAAFAQQSAPLSRAEVKQQALAARANGTLAHAGDAGPEEMTPYKAQVEAPSTMTRAEGKSVVLQARAAHQLAHAGTVAPEEEMAYARTHPSTSTVTSAEVRQQVLAARASGTLIPAGQGDHAKTHAKTTRSIFVAKPAADDSVS